MYPKREGIKKGIYILPNLFTTANLFCGFYSIIRAISGDYTTAAWVLMLAAIFDFLDGRIARLTKTQSEFGLEYDSLVDLASFGLAPALLIYMWSLNQFGRVGWAAAFLFFACGALRLARFNVQAGDVERKTFQGLPIPAGAGSLASYVILSHSIEGPQTLLSGTFAIGLTFILAFLMVSNIPYRSFKKLDNSPRANFFFLVMAVATIVIIASAPQIMLFVFAIGYIILGITEEVLRSPQKIRSFADFMMRFFQADPKEIILKDSEEGDGKVIEMNKKDGNYGNN